MKSRIIICGGSGLIGQALQRHLASVGYDVRIVARKPSVGEYGWDQLTECLDGALAVVNLAGKPIACRFTETAKREILESRVNSSQMVGEAIERCLVKPARWINASAVGFYGDRGEEVVDEGSQPGEGFVADVCRAWEDACLSSGAETDKMVIRFGVVLTSGGGALKKLIQLTNVFLGGQVGSGGQWMSWIAMKDLVRLIQWSIEHDMPPIVNGCAPEPIRNRDLMSWLRMQLHRPWSPPVPTFVLKVFGKLVGPDASLLLDSTRAVPTQIGEFRFDFPSLENIKLSEL